MEMKFCEKWWYPRKRAIKPLTKEQAEKYHLAKKPYSVIFTEGESIEYILDISENDIFVGYMNDNCEKYLTYAFHREKEDDLFLNAVYYHDYDENNIETEILIFGFETTGQLFMEKRNLLTGDVEEREAKVDISCNWEKFPKFGEYDSLIKKERELDI